MKTMKISVIIPNYNNSKFLIKCLDSIYSQTYNNIEVIFVDDGSTDNSIEVVKKYKEDNNVELKIYKQFNQNAAIARNYGINNSTGDILYFLDSDDEVYDNDVFMKVKDYFEEYDLIIGNYKKISEDGKEIGDYIAKREFSIYDNNRYKYSLISPVPSNKFYKKDIVVKYDLYFDNVRIGQDLNFYLKYLSVCNNIKIMEDYIYKYRILNSSMSRSKNFNLFDITNTFICIKKFYSSNNNLDNYDKYISLVELKHYKWQMEKLINYSDYKSKKLIYTYFSYFISNINFIKVIDKRKLNMELLEYKIKKIFKYIYLSNSYSKLKKCLKRKMMKNESN